MLLLFYTYLLQDYQNCLSHLSALFRLPYRLNQPMNLYGILIFRRIIVTCINDFISVGICFETVNNRCISQYSYIKVSCKFNTVFCHFCSQRSCFVSSLLVILPAVVTTAASEVDQVTPSCVGIVISSVTAVKSPNQVNLRIFVSIVIDYKIIYYKPVANFTCTPVSLTDICNWIFAEHIRDINCLNQHCLFLFRLHNVRYAVSNRNDYIVPFICVICTCCRLTSCTGVIISFGS